MSILNRLYYIIADSELNASHVRLSIFDYKAFKKYVEVNNDLLTNGIYVFDSVKRAICFF